MSTANFNYKYLSDDIYSDMKPIKLYVNFPFLNFSHLFRSPVKKALNKILVSVISLEDVLENISTMDREKINLLFTSSQKIALSFDRLHDSIESKNYFNDDDYEYLVKTIGRKLHKIENISRKHTLNFKGLKSDDYLKEGLENYSKESISKHVIR